MATTTKLVELFNADETIAALSTQAFVEAAYENLLGLSGDFSNKDARVAYWVAKIDAGLATADFAATFLAAAAVQGDLLTDAEFAVNTATLVAVAALDETDLTLAAVKAAAVAAVEESEAETPDANAGETFTLTTGTDSGDSFKGGDQNDTYTADVLTLGAGDNLDGGAGTDTLNVTANAAIANTVTAANIENVNLTALGAVSVDMANISGVNSFTSKDSTGNITITNADNAGMALGFSGATSNNIAVTYDAGTLSGSSDKIMLNVDSAKNVTTSVPSGFESAELAINGTGNTITSITAPGAAMTISGSGDTTFAADALVGTSSITVTNTAALKFGAISTTDVATFTATANTGGITGSTALTAGNIYSTDDIDGATTGLTMMLGSGNDNLKVTEAAAASKTNTIKLGAGDDILHVTNAGAGATYLFGEAGDDKIKVDTTALETTDLVSGGEGTDTLTVAGNLINNLTLLSVENLVLSGTTGAKTTVSSSDTAVAVEVKAADNDEVDVAGLTAGSTVTVNAAATTAGAAAAAKIQQVDVAFANTEASSTIDFNTAVDMTNATTALTVTNVTDLTLDFAEIVGAAAAGLLDVQGATGLTINAAKDIAFDDISAGSEKLKTITVNASDKVTFEEILNDQALTTVSVTAVDNVDLGAGAKFVEDADTLTTVSVTSSAGSVAIGEIGDNSGTTSDPDNLESVILSGATTVTAGIIEADKIGNVSMTATNGLLTVTEITSAADMGTVDLTSTAGAIKIDTGDIVAADTTGITVNATAKTFINVTGATGGAKADVTNSKGDITATLAGAAVATIDYTAGTQNTTGQDGSVNLTASSLTGGLTTTVTNNELATATGTSSTITLGALNSTTVNSVTLAGYTNAVNVTGSIGKDTIVNSAGGDTISVTNSSDTYVGGAGTDTLSYAGNTHNAASGTNGAGQTTDGYAMNFTNDTITFDVSAVTGATNVTTLAAGKVAQYDSTATSSTATTAGNIVAGGEMDTVSGFEIVIGSGKNDYIAVSNTGMTVTGGAGADKIVLNSGVDTVVTAAASSVALTAETVTEAGILATETITFGNGVDVVTNFTAGAGKDKLDVDNAAAIATAALGANHTGDTSANTYYLSGNFVESTGVFTITANGSGADTLIFEGTAGADLTSVDTAVVLVGVDSDDLHADNFI